MGPLLWGELAIWLDSQGQSLAVAGPAFSFCACVASAQWARLCGAGRVSATEPVTGADQTLGNAPPDIPTPAGRFLAARSPYGRDRRLERDRPNEDERVFAVAVAASAPNSRPPPVAPWNAPLPPVTWNVVSMR